MCSLRSEPPKASKAAGAPLLEVFVEKEPSSPLPVVPSKDDKKEPPHPLAVAVAAAMVIRNVKVPPPSPPPASMDKEKPPAVVLVCMWALVNAISFAGNAVVTLIRNRHPCTKSTWWFRCAKVTRAAAAEASTMRRGQLWCAAPQAALAAAMALVVAGSGRRWSRRWACAWALVALAATAAGHYMEGRVDRIFLAAAPGDAYITADAVANCVFVMLDLLGFFCLVTQIRDAGEE